MMTLILILFPEITLRFLLSYHFLAATYGGAI